MKSKLMQNFRVSMCPLN